MKRIRRGSSRVYYSFPFLCFVYVLIVIASFLLADHGFAGVFSATLFNTPRGILLLVAGPFALLAFLGLFLYSAIADSLHAGSAGRLSSRAFLVTAILLFSVTLPETVIVCRFVGTAVGSWYDRSVSDSLAAVEDVAGLYVDERAQSMEKVSSRFFTGLSITAYRARPTDWMSEIRAIDPHAVACQVYRAERAGDATSYVPVIEAGDSERFVSHDFLGQVQKGLFTLDGETDSFRYGAVVRYSNNAYVCVYTSDIPSGFTERLERVRATRAQARIIDTLKPYLPLMGLWIFAMFLLPPIMMALIVAYRAACAMAEPIRAIAEGSARLAEGDPSWRIVPRSGDETAEIARLVNSIASRASAARSQGKRLSVARPSAGTDKTPRETPDKRGPNRL
ncbi:MAG TPA: hypothetical protein PK542_03705 [Treponemataceae bacterium]|nr:hypothetical protein [Treponemataceae bacterium]